MTEEVANADAGLLINPTSVKPMFHQENTLLNDFNSAAPNLFDTTGNAGPPGPFVDRINYDSNQGLNNAMVQTIENAAPPLKYVDSLNQDLTTVTNFVSKKVNSIS